VGAHRPTPHCSRPLRPSRRAGLRAARGTGSHPGAPFKLTSRVAGSSRKPLCSTTGALRPAWRRGTARLQFIQFEGLDQVVVDASVEPGHPVAERVARGQHDHRRRILARSQLAQHVRGRLWPASQDEGETSLGEAGIQQQATYGYFCVGVDGRFDGHAVCRRTQAEPWGTAWVLTTQRGWGWAPAAAAQRIQPPALVCGAAHRPSQKYRLEERREKRDATSPSTTKEKT
jgi:hypothetical protein